jgi:hypothetical protein
MTGCGVCAGTLSLCIELSGAVLAGLTAPKAGDCTSSLTPLIAGGDPAVRAGVAEIGAVTVEVPFGPVSEVEAGTGVPAFPCGDGRDDREPCTPSRTCFCCRKSASLSTMIPGVAELRAPGVFGSDPGLCLSLSFSCCLGAGAADDMLSLSLGCGGSSTLALASARRL